ncbi:MAG: lipoyl(octanoyl) transferase LipB [Chloroflexi bacterium]|nr:lipoyl(octanoyl) transferase LipB [Chloroflexota bacterium]
MWLGPIEYAAAWGLQRRLASQRVEGRLDDTLLLLEHPPVYTYGRRGADGSLLVPKGQLEALGARVYEVDRGGGMTFHGPGQLIGYPVIDLRSWKEDVHAYLRALEDVIIRTLAPYGIQGERAAGLTGVWAGREKIAAIGVKVSRWVTSHGFALNVNVDLGWYRHIVACGIPDRGVTSMRRLLGREIDLEEVARAAAGEFGAVFGRCVSYSREAPSDPGARVPA